MIETMHLALQAQAQLLGQMGIANPNPSTHSSGWTASTAVSDASSDYAAQKTTAPEKAGVGTSDAKDSSTSMAERKAYTPSPSEHSRESEEKPL